ncbi:MAG: LPS export ABC transporter periplasmic protein LptC [Sphingomonadales bacterium]|nr:LPS export ABC transporter periplasmic protein LptC [Sphingomonadales bacterium]
MSDLADRQKTQRQHWAAPGSRHDRLIRALRVILPSIIGILLALLTFSPFTNSNELSFVLDKDRVNMAAERMRISEALYRGEDSKGRPFSLRAGSAVQKSSAEPVIRMSDLSARILLDDGPAALVAGQGAYDLDAETMRVNGPLSVKSSDGYSLLANNVLLTLKTQILRSNGTVSFTGKDGYALTANNVQVNLPERNMQSFGPVRGSTKVGTFSANSMSADMDSRIVTLSGNAKLRIEGNAFR